MITNWRYYIWIEIHIGKIWFNILLQEDVEIQLRFNNIRTSKKCTLQKISYIAHTWAKRE